MGRMAEMDAEQQEEENERNDEECMWWHQAGRQEEAKSAANNVTKEKHHGSDSEQQQYKFHNDASGCACSKVFPHGRFGITGNRIPRPKEDGAQNHDFVGVAR